MKLTVGVLDLSLVGTNSNSLQHCTSTYFSWSPKIQARPKLPAVDRQQLQGIDEGISHDPTVLALCA